MSDRYFVEEKRIGKIRQFGITFSKGAKFYNVADERKINEPIGHLDKYSAVDQCDYLNNYDSAERFIVCRNKNNVYWIFVKRKQMNFTASNSYVKSTSGVNYTKMTQGILYQKLTKLETGCNSFEEAEELIQQIYVAYKKSSNSKSFEIVNSSCPAE